MNELARFPDGPPDDLLIYWDREEKRWRVWFDKCPPMYADGDYNSFREKTFHYRSLAPNIQLGDILQSAAQHAEVLSFLNGEEVNLDSLRNTLRHLAAQNRIALA